MRVTKRQLRRIIREQLDQGPGVSSTAEFDNEYVTFPDGRNMEQEALAVEVAPRAEWDDNFDKIKMYAAIALKQNHGVTTVTDYELPGESWSVDEFIALMEEISSEEW